MVCLITTLISMTSPALDCYVKSPYFRCGEALVVLFLTRLLLRSPNEVCGTGFINEKLVCQIMPSGGFDVISILIMRRSARFKAVLKA